MLKEIEERVNEYLDEQEIIHSTIAYQYLLYGITLLIRNERLREQRKIMIVYEEIGNRYDASPLSVERAIRYLLKKSNIRMTNGQFMFLASDTLAY